MREVICPYCKSPAILTDSKAALGKRYARPLYVCSDYPICDAYVGVHRGTDKPLGRLADPELRALKIEAHRFFDPLWIFGTMTRRQAYKWLRETLNKDTAGGHIAELNAAECYQLIEALKAR